jgi:beta-lactamase class A
MADLGGPNARIRSEGSDSSAGLASEMARLSETAGGRFGIAVIDTKLGARVLVNGSESFPAASTFKIGLAARVLSLVDQRELSLAQMVELLPADRVIYGVIDDQLIHPGVSLSLLNWLELMLKLSDNSATDLLLRVVGGPAALTDWVSRRIGPGYVVKRTTSEEVRLTYRLPLGAGTSRLTNDPGVFSDDRAMSPQERAEQSGFLATPSILAEVLFKVWYCDLLQPQTAKLMRGIMQRCEPHTHIAGKLPLGTVVAHKTGLDYGSVNDVGAITLPRDRGELIIAVLNSGQLKPNSVSLEVIADIARAAFDYFCHRSARSQSTPC